jgi:hypothetical protein
MLLHALRRLLLLLLQLLQPHLLHRLYLRLRLNLCLLEALPLTFKSQYISYIKFISYINPLYQGLVRLYKVTT